MRWSFISGAVGFGSGCLLVMVASSSCCLYTSESGLDVRHAGVSDSRVLGVVGVVLAPAALDRQAQHAVTAVPVPLPFELTVPGVADLGRGPLRGIAEEVFDAVRAPPRLETRRVDGYQARGLVAGQDGVDLTRAGSARTPREPPAVGSPGRAFPFRLGGQPSADPGTERGRVIRRHVDHGMEAVALHVLLVVVGLLGQGAPSGLDAQAVLLVGDLVDLH